MTDRPDQHGCPNCAKLEARLAKLKAEMATLQSELAKARKNSANSSKPPSSDIVNPSPKGGKRGRPGKRKRGAQPGHTRNQRDPFPPEEIDVGWIHYYDGCPCCGGHLEDSDEPAKTLQQVEIKGVPIEVLARGLKKGRACGPAINNSDRVSQIGLPYVFHVDP
jgi:transposase